MKPMYCNDCTLERLPPDAPLPMDLLLLADETTDAIAAYVHDCEVWVVRQQQTMVAVACVLKVDADCVELKNLAVATALQGQGVGSGLLGALKRHYAATYAQMLVGTADVGHAQQRFYRRHGFVRSGTHEHFFITHYPEPIIENGQQLVDMHVFACDLHAEDKQAACKP